MKCKILHESKNRIRIRLYRKYMTCAEADKVEYFLLSLPFVTEVKVSERTSDAVIRYDDRNREKLIKELSHFSLTSTEVAVPEHTGREITHSYQDRMFFHVARRIVTRIVLPIPVRNVITGFKMIPYLWEGLKSILKGRLNVSQLRLQKPHHQEEPYFLFLRR